MNQMISKYVSTSFWCYVKYENELRLYNKVIRNQQSISWLYNDCPCFDKEFHDQGKQVTRIRLIEICSNVKKITHMTVGKSPYRYEYDM